MKKNYVIYLIIPLLLLITGITLISCGGGEDGYVNPGLQGEPSDQLISKEVSGYIYHTGSLSSSETGEVTEKFIILSSPARGDDSFLSQLWGYFEETSPDSLNTQEMQNLHSRLSVEMENYVPLPEWNPSAKLYSIYQDSKSSASISVDGSGYFSSTVPVSPGDDNVSFEVILGEDACYPVEAIASSDIASTSEDGVVLKSCPEMILTLPGWFEIFAVYGNPSVNLKDAGLTFTLNDPSMGWVTEPFYLKCNGVRNYNVAYGIYISAGNLETPVSTTITAQTATGLTLNIFTEVVKSCGSISGHVGGAGVVPFCGFVYSLGWDAFSCIDEAGNYQLDKVFKGHFRKVVAVYWVQINGQLVKHREERTIDFFNGNLTGIDLPEGVQSTPTPRAPLDSYYEAIGVKIIKQKWLWEDELGIEQGVQKTVDWLNGNVADPPVPPEISEAIAKAEIVNYDIIGMRIYFTDGKTILFSGLGPWSVPISSIENDIILRSQETNNNYLVSGNINSSGDDETVESKILILDPYWWNMYGWFFGDPNDPSDFGDIKHVSALMSIHGDNLTDEFHYDAKVKMMKKYYLEGPGLEPTPTTGDYDFKLVAKNEGWGGDFYPILSCEIINEDNIIRPEDFETLDDYGIIYIHTHGTSFGLSACPIYEEDGQPDEQLKEWLMENWDWEELWTESSIGESGLEDTVVRCVSLKPEFFSNQNFSNSLVYINACSSWWFHLYGGFSDAKVYMGNNKPAGMGWSDNLAYYFFQYMIYGYEPPENLMPTTPPSPSYTPVSGRMSVKEAYDILGDVGAYPDPHSYTEPGMEEALDCKLMLDTDGGDHDNTYFPAAPFGVIVQ